MANRRASNAACPLQNKRRRTGEEDYNLASKRRLYAMLKKESCPDVDLLVTDKEKIKRLCTHKNILVEMSSVMASELRRRMEDIGRGRHVVKIPPGVGVCAVEMFIKFLYTEELNDDLSVDFWLELIFLAEYYKVRKLKALCDWELIDKLNLGNCIKIYEKSRLIQDGKCGETAFNFIKKHLREILSSFSKELIQMDACTWETILGLNYLKDVEEIELFKALKGWKDENVKERASVFRELVKLIRFPLIGMENFIKFVAPVQILDMELTLEMLMYFADRGPIPEQFKDCQPRNLLEPRDSLELAKFIDEAQNGDVIELDGTYSPFIIPESKTNLTIRKKNGGKAIIKLIKIGWSVIAIKKSGIMARRPQAIGISIYGQKCKIDGISIIFDKNKEYEFRGIYVKESANQTTLQNITISGCYIGLQIHGEENSISNITVIDPKKAGIGIWEGSKNNEVSNCSVFVENKNFIGAYGFILEGDGNKICNLRAKNTKNVVGSKGNVIKGFEISGESWNFGLVVKGADHHLENVRVTGENSILRLCSKSKNISVISCHSDRILN